MYTLDLIGITKDATTAGPGKRLELFTKGCIRGVISPCQGCFNEETWTFEGQRRTFGVNELADMIERDAWNRQVTFCGGEPILQAIALTALAKELKSRDEGFHFVMYTAYKLDTLFKYGLKFTWLKKHGQGMRDFLMKHSMANKYVVKEYDHKIEFTILYPEEIIELMKYVDIIVDGDYQQDKRLTTDQYMHEGWFIGSSNQRVIFCDQTLEKGTLIYLPAEVYNIGTQEDNHCKCCGHQIKRREMFCNDICETRYKDRVAFLNSHGLQVKEGIY